MNANIQKFRDQLKDKLNPGRYEHTLSVSYTAMALAMRYEYDLDKAEIAGLLHDCAKCYSDTAIIEKCKKNGIALTDNELLAPALIHAKLGAFMAREKYGVEDQEILDAIQCHTTGKPDMGLLDKILYVADYIEPRRYQAEDLTHLRKTAFVDLDKALFQMMEGTLNYLEQRGGFVDNQTRAAYEYYRMLQKG